MTGLGNLIRRNCKLFFKDKAMFFTSLITPMILLVLYATFLAKVYRDSFASSLPKGMDIPQKLIDATAGGELLSSLLAVSCVTVSVCCNALMVQDKVTGARRDLTMTPVRRSTLALSYYFATIISTLIICILALGAGMLYLAKVGWYMSAGDVFLLLSDVVLLVLFGTALSSVTNFFLSSQGQISAVGTIISAGYGFICGAYMPISQFGAGLQKVISFLPGTYGTSLLRNHALRGVYAEMEAQRFPAEIIESIKDSIDCNLYFFGTKVSLPAMYGILCGAIVLLIGGYVLLNLLHHKAKK